MKNVSKTKMDFVVLYRDTRSESCVATHLVKSDNKNNEAAMKNI